MGISGKITDASGETVFTEVDTVDVTPDAAGTLPLTCDSCVTGFSGNTANVISGGYTLSENSVALTGTK